MQYQTVIFICSAWFPLVQLPGYYSVHKQLCQGAVLGIVIIPVPFYIKQEVRANPYGIKSVGIVCLVIFIVIYMKFSYIKGNVSFAHLVMLLHISVNEKKIKMYFFNVRVWKDNYVIMNFLNFLQSFCLLLCSQWLSDFEYVNNISTY